MGITGIVKINGKIKNYYLLQVRSKTTAASRDKIQWSFAGLIDFISKNFNPYELPINFFDFIKDELSDEVLNRKFNFKNKEEKLFKSFEGKEKKLK